ncbi:hypothetical protein RintRC_1086 [Richelia intracellularis]|nr:hypothetical protein RintRC_1086 [Richelia intracellularis]
MVFGVFAVISDMNLGIIESYDGGDGGFLEVIPEGDGSDYWLIAGVHINGEAYRPSARLFRSERSAFTKAQKIYDWIANHENQVQGWGCWCADLKITLWHQSKEYPSCSLS